jgi:thiol:disulfide interchange protein DsbC
MKLGQELGVNGTPAIMLENGQLYPGYAPAGKLIKVLDQIKTTSK